MKKISLEHPNHPNVTIERTERQAAVLAKSGWSPVGETPDDDNPPAGTNNQGV